MAIKNNQYLFLVLFHILLGIIIFYFPFLSKVYSFSIFILKIYFIVKNENKNHEVLYASAYIVGAEVFLRATNGNLSYEFGKYCVVLFMILGISFSGIFKKGYLYFAFILFLIPGILISLYTNEARVFNKILFSVSGPICLGISSLYTINKRINKEEINEILLAIGLPSITTCFYLLVQSPPILESIKSCQSNFLLSANFGPNQMATSLGLGVFVFFLRLILIKTNKITFFINCVVLSLIFHRALLTFSRGGILTGIIIIVILLASILFYAEYRSKIVLKIGFFVVLFSSIFIFTSCETNDRLLERYNKNSLITILQPKGNAGRPDLAITEINMFVENPIFGIGAGGVATNRKLELKTELCSHNEITRLMAEHGVFGILSILILLIIPFQLYFENKNNIYFFSFYAFWFLTINHSAMRIAAPSLIYSLTLLNINFNNASDNSII